MKLLPFPSPSSPKAFSSRAMQGLWEALLQLVYPSCCLGCEVYVKQAQPPLCHRCLRRLERPNLEMLAARLAWHEEAAQTLSHLFALWLFDTGGTVQRVQHRLKYGNRPALGLALGRILGTAYREVGTSRPDLVVPIPLHTTHLFERGYNQSALLAQGMAETLAVPYLETILHRHRATRSQIRLSRTRRWDNVSGAFSVRDKEAVATRHVLLVDDVFTTGATLVAAALTLKEAGAAKVSAATLALARS